MQEAASPDARRQSHARNVWQNIASSLYRFIMQASPGALVHMRSFAAVITIFQPQASADDKQMHPASQFLRLIATALVIAI